MKVTYTPEDPAVSGDGGKWAFDPNRVLGAHAEMIERRYGKTWEQFTLAVMQGSIKARRVLLWYFRMLQHPGYRLEDLPDFYTGELVVSFDTEEVARMRDTMSKTEFDTEEERDQMMTALDVMMSDAMAEEEAEARQAAGGREVDDDEGKALLPNVESSTG